MANGSKSTDEENKPKKRLTKGKKSVAQESDEEVKPKKQMKTATKAKSPGKEKAVKNQKKKEIQQTDHELNVDESEESN